jgi:predicted negative regulator of RcsB-dependent stress response
MRKEWLAFVMGGVLGLGLLLGWAWYDGGIREQRAMSAPAVLPGEAR